MRKPFVLVIVLLLLSGSSALSPEPPNDTALQGKGDHLVPLKETDIEIHREVLNMQLQGRDMLVDVHFEFYNPGDTTMMEVGFVTPPVSEGSHALKGEGSPIEDFRVIANGEELDHEVQKLGESEFDAGLGKQHTDFDFVHHFEMQFLPGLNVVKHSYRYGGSRGSTGGDGYPYRLTTAKNWGNGSIGDFSLNLDMGQGLFYVTPNFEEGTEGSGWKVIGKGRTEMTDRNYSELKVYTGKNAYLSFQKKNFVPERDLSITHRAFFTTAQQLGPILPLDHEGNGQKDDLFKDMWRIIARRGRSPEKKMEELRKNYDASQLRILRNSFFAFRGYDFKDDDLQENYEQYFWYIPDPNVEPSLHILSPKEREWVKRIQKLEKEKSGN